MEKLAAEVVTAINQCRTEPRFWIKILEQYKKAIVQGVFTDPESGLRFDLHEGEKAVQAAIDHLASQKSTSFLMRHPGLDHLAQAHADYLGASGHTDHRGPQAEGLADRVGAKYRWEGALAENVSVANSNANSVVIDLLVDDGDITRSRRRNMLFPE